VKLNELLTDKVTCSQYIFLKLLDNSEELRKFIAQGLITTDEFEDLKSKKFITSESDLNGEILPTEKTKKKFNIKDSTFFDEFYMKYPAFVVRPDNLKDYLRLNIKECRKIYNKLVGKSQKFHDHMIKCLDCEIEYRKKNNGLKYMVRMQKWLNTQQWQMAEEMMKDKTNTMSKIIETSYGTELI